MGYFLQSAARSQDKAVAAGIPSATATVESEKPANAKLFHQ
jgi:hypothetical protein